MIVYGGSCANVVSLSMMEKLNIYALTHPHPYNIQWLIKVRACNLTQGA